MWTQQDSNLPSVLIVQGENGDVFIVENVESETQVEKILKTEKPSRSTRKKKQQVEIKARESSPLTDLNLEIKVEEDEIVEEYLDYESVEESVKQNTDEVNIVRQNVQTTVSSTSIPAPSPTENISETIREMTVSVFEPTFDGRWSDESLQDEFRGPVKKSLKRKNTGARSTFWSHKSRSLAGKIACKYCDTVFSSKNEQTEHECKYLNCNPKNFICRICGKELSKKTFSNHLHETLDCQYCGKQFVNPRNMKAHIERKHRGEKYIPPKPKTFEEIKARILEAAEPPQVEKKKRRPIRTKERLECDLCGKYLVSIRSMSYHMSLHTGQSVYICENCGEKFYTPNGIKGHSCVKKRRRPEKDFRTYDLRHCRFCDSRFASYDENKSHSCKYQVPDDPKSVFCRCCGKALLKLAFNRHMEIHTGIDWHCSVCSRKLATERALKVHMTTHSGNKPYKCNQCSDSFINKVVLDRHMRFHGLIVKNFRCEFCFKSLSTQTSLQSHVQRVHKPTRQCELCKLEFKTREELKLHMTDDHKPSVCPICSKSFALPRYLKMHEKLHYDDSLPREQCPVCLKFLTIKNIKSHVFRKHQDHFEAWQQMNPSL